MNCIVCDHKFLAMETKANYDGILVCNTCEGRSKIEGLGFILKVLHEKTAKCQKKQKK